MTVAIPSLADWLARTLTLLPAETCPGVQLWLHDLLEDAPAAALAWLSAEEQARAERFAFECDRRRYRGSHVGLRHVLAAVAGVAPAELIFRPGPNGKPSLAGAAATLNFNMSHCADWALIGVATDSSLGELGVDLELLRPVQDVWPMARAQFTEREVAELQALPAAALAHHFLIGWTRKEACLKAMGSGFSIPSDSFYGGVLDKPLDTTVPTPQGDATLHLRGLALGEGKLGAVAWRR